MIRTWAFADGERPQALQRRQGQLDENVLVGEGWTSVPRKNSPLVEPLASLCLQDTHTQSPVRGLTDDVLCLLRSVPAALDNVLAESAKRGIRLILTFTNYWDDYGAGCW